MKTTNQNNPGIVTIPKSAIVIEKVHRCEHCPIRQMAMKQPRSVFARIHSWHKTWWPGWKAYQARTCSCTAGVGIQAR